MQGREGAADGLESGGQEGQGCGGQGCGGEESGGEEGDDQDSGGQEGDGQERGGQEGGGWRHAAGKFGQTHRHVSHEGAGVDRRALPRGMEVMRGGKTAWQTDRLCTPSSSGRDKAWMVGSCPGRVHLASVLGGSLAAASS
eukprot:202836-Chlamydomonas_euryale.AAC.1